MLMIGFVIAQIILLIVIVLVLRKLIFSDTNSAISRLTKIDNQNREKQRLLTQKLEQAQRYIEEQKRLMKDEEQKIKAEARRAANQLHEDIIQKAKDEADDIIKKAHASRTQMRAEATIEAEGRMLDFCSEILTQVLGKLMGGELNERLVEEFIEELRKADLTKVAPEARDVTLVSSLPLKREQLDRVQDLLTVKLQRRVDLKTEQNPEVLGGMCLKLGTIQVDGTLAERIRGLAQEMKENLAFKHAPQS